MKALKLMILVPFVAIVIQNANAAGKKVILVHNAEKPVIAKNELFGYQKDAKDFRLFNKAEYQILSSSGIIIYSKSSLVQQGGKGPKPTELFYFSESASSPILSLTIANLESVYGKNQKFMYAVESLFKSDSELSSYDAYNKQFKLAYLYTENTK